jgi:hypothetical protein
MIRIVDACALAILAMSCRASPPPAKNPSDGERKEQPAAMDPYSPPWKLVVADGSANVYACECPLPGPAQCRYRPVRPEESSTGMYSGGDPWEVELTSAQIDALWREVDAASRNTAGHTDLRAKTTIAVEADGATKASFILEADAGVALLQVLKSLHP